MNSSPPSGFRKWLPWFRAVVFALVIVGLGYAFYNAWLQLRTEDIEVFDIHWTWIAVGTFLYSIALLICGLFWRVVLLSLNGQASILEALRAFATSQLGKYIPGKAMVVVIRTDLIRSPNTSIGAAITSVFIETLMWIFVGAQIASAFFLFSNAGSTSLRIMAASIMVVCGLVTLPPNFGRVLRFVSRLKGRSASNGEERSLTWRTYFCGIVMLTVGWFVAGLSAYAIVAATPGAECQPQDFWLILAAVSLATVGGFVSLLPGGIGVRELVIIPLLAPRFSTLIAVVAALLIRLAWIVAELLFFVTIETLYRIRKTQK